MTNYIARPLTYRPIENTPDNAALLAAYGVTLAMPESVAVLVVELDRIESILPNLDEFHARYTPAE